jgi:hypothetical protein
MSSIEPEKKGSRRWPSVLRESGLQAGLGGGIDGIMTDVPEAALSRVPADGAERHDEYLYGAGEHAQRES